MNIDNELINKYLLGKCNSEEVVAIQKHLTEHKLSLDDIIPLSDWQNASPASYQKESLLYDNLIEQIRKQQIRRRRNYLVRISQLAAVLALLFGLFYFLPTSQPEIKNLQTTAEPIDELIDIPQINNLFYINSSNKDLILYTSDSSKIVLTPGSQIRYAEDFATLEQREIQLKGKATFYVNKNKDKPFKVHSKNMTTTALGTIFTVDELNSQSTRVQLLEGEIEIKQLHKETPKKANKKETQQLIRHFSQSGELLLDHSKSKILAEVKPNKKTGNRNGYFKEQFGEIIIKNLAVEDILAILENNYQVQLHYDASLVENHYFSATFPSSKQVYTDVIDEINYLHQTNISLVKK